MNFQPGDIAACYGTDWTSRLIRWQTLWPVAPRKLKLGPSHVAILCEFRHDLVWVESTTLCKTPCIIRQQRVDGVQAHLPEDRIADYLDPGGQVELYRLTTLNRLTREDSERLQSLLIQELLLNHVAYNLSGALLSGTRFLQLTRLLPAPSLRQLFCSELIAAVLMRLGLMNRSNPMRFNPARLLRELVHTGTYSNHATLGGGGS